MYEPRFYRMMKNPLREMLKQRPEDHASRMSADERDDAYVAGFHRDPLFYMMLLQNEDIVYGITTTQLRAASERANLYLTRERIRQILKQALIVLKKTVQSDEEWYTMDCAFPKVLARNIGESCRGAKRARVVPVYMLPFVLKTVTLGKQPRLSNLLSQFEMRLLLHHAENRRMAQFGAAHLQLRANLNAMFTSSCITDVQLHAEVESLRAAVATMQRRLGNVERRLE